MSERKILFPTDFSHTGDSALELAMTLARQRVAEAVVRRAPCPVLTLRQPSAPEPSPTPMQPGEA